MHLCELRRLTEVLASSTCCEVPNAISSAASAHKQATATGSALLNLPFPGTQLVGATSQVLRVRPIFPRIFQPAILMICYCYQCSNKLHWNISSTNADGALELTENFNGEIKITDVKLMVWTLLKAKWNILPTSRAMMGPVVVGEIRKLRY